MNKSNFDKSTTNIIKGIAVLLLLFHHLFLKNDRLIANGVVISDGVYNLLYAYIVQARICVWIFVFISGYGLAKSFSKDEKCGKFIVHHWLSLMKQWWIVMLFMAVIYQVFVGNLIDYYQHSIKLFLLDVIEWNDFFDYPRILGSWYLCFAQILIIIFPLLYIFCKKYGYLSLPIFYIVMQFIGDGINSSGGGAYIQYIPAAIGGIISAQYGIFEILLAKNQSNRIVTFLKGTILLMGIAILSEIRYRVTDTNYICSILAVFIVFGICLFTAKYICKLKIKGILEFLGENSAILFMSNVFFYIELPQTIYFTHNAVGAYITLVLVCLMFALVIKQIIKILHYDDICKKIENYLLTKVGER